MHATLSNADILALKSIRSLPTEHASTLRAAIFAAFKAGFGIPQEHKVKVEIDAVGTPQYGVIVRKKNGKVYPLDAATGKWVDPDAAPAPEAKRWFAVDMEDAISDITNYNFFGDGELDSDMPEDCTKTRDGAVDSEGQLYIQLAESDF